MTSPFIAFDGRTINTGVKVPEVLYVFVNRFHPVTWHNIEITGQFSSAAISGATMEPKYLEQYLNGTADYTPFLPNQQAFPALSMFGAGVVSQYAVEYDAESYRRRHCRLYPSRFSAVYAFGDMETCATVSARYHWPLSSVMPFRLQELPITRIARVNMEHISVARDAYRLSTVGDQDAVWQAYWSGAEVVTHNVPAAGGARQDLTSGVIWEYLVDGILVRADR